ncbi:glutathione-disulfide reductase [Rhodomicrobium sp. Az07]|nr:glutathione-disulfide reductase [Rhodomicrobium sp. Az07]
MRLVRSSHEPATKKKLMRFDYDLFVIGGGSGGVRSARLASKLGVRTAIAEEYKFGGTCVVRGCVPKKLFVYASEFGRAIDDAHGYGWTVEGKRFDWKALVAAKDKEIERLSGLYSGGVEAAGGTVFNSRAEVVDPHTVRLLAEDRTVTAERILIATGGHPFLPDIPGIEHAITSNEAFHLEELPKKIVIVGGGYIAVEFAGIFNGLGVDVELVYRGGEILRGFDHDMREGLTSIMRQHGVTITCNTEPVAIEKTGTGLVVATNRDTRIACDLTMFATGRRPNTVGLGLQKLGVKCGWNGRVMVNDSYQSSVPSIYAVGDVTDRVNLTPVAIRDGMAFIEAVYKNNPNPVDLAFLPTAVFSQPEIGTVGYTEEAAREMFRAVDIYKSAFRPMKNTLAGRPERTIMKLIVDAESDRVLGVHILGPDAAEIIQAIAIAVKMGATKADFDDTIALHPTMAEELVTMREKWTPPAGA